MPPESGSSLVELFRVVTGRPERTGRLSLLWILTTACEQGHCPAPAIEALAGGARRSWQERLRDFASQLRMGLSVSDAAHSVPGLLDPQSLLALRVGEDNNTLAGSLRSEAERQSRVVVSPGSRTPGSIVVYVSAMVVVMALVLTGLAIEVVPELQKTVEDFGAEMPPISGWLFAVTQSPYFLALVVPTMLAGFLLPIVWLLWSSGLRYNTLSLRRFFPRLDLGAVLSQLGIVVEQGRPLSAGLHTLAFQHPNQTMIRRLTPVFEALEAGNDCWEEMSNQGLLRYRERRLLQAAEKAGNLSWALQLVGREIDQAQAHKWRSGSQLVQPLAVAVFGTMIAVVGLAVFAPLITILSGFTP